jgi:hypothetical protein
MIENKGIAFSSLTSPTAFFSGSERYCTPFIEKDPSKIVPAFFRNMSSVSLFKEIEQDIIMSGDFEVVALNTFGFCTHNNADVDPYKFGWVVELDEEDVERFTKLVCYALSPIIPLDIATQYTNDAGTFLYQSLYEYYKYITVNTLVKHGWYIMLPGDFEFASHSNDLIYSGNMPRNTSFIVMCPECAEAFADDLRVSKLVKEE